MAKLAMLSHVVCRRLSVETLYCDKTAKARITWPRCK